MRSRSLDVFRGIAVAAIVFANQALAANHVYRFIGHAPWNGWLPLDVFFPMFLFAVGASISLSFSRAGAGTAALHAKLLKRAAVLFGLGLLLNGFFQYELATLRTMGVLQRIAICYLVTGLAALHLRAKGQVGLGALLLASYTLTMLLFPVPGFGAGVLTREANFGSYVDRLLIGQPHLYPGDDWNRMGDPYGVFGTGPAVVNTLIGYWALENLRDRPASSSVSMDLMLTGLACAAAGQIWGWVLPINRKLWTSSFALLTGGMSLMAFAACFELFDVRKMENRWASDFEALGRNALLAFVGVIVQVKLLIFLPIGRAPGAPSLLESLLSGWLAPWLGAFNAPVFLAGLTLVGWGAVLGWMRRRGWILKV